MAFGTIERSTKSRECISKGNMVPFAMLLGLKDDVCTAPGTRADAREPGNGLQAIVRA